MIVYIQQDLVIHCQDGLTDDHALAMVDYFDPVRFQYDEPTQLLTIPAAKYIFVEEEDARRVLEMINDYFDFQVEYVQHPEHVYLNVYPA